MEVKVKCPIGLCGNKHKRYAKKKKKKQNIFPFCCFTYGKMI